MAIIICVKRLPFFNRKYSQVLPSLVLLFGQSQRNPMFCQPKQIQILSLDLRM